MPQTQILVNSASQEPCTMPYSEDTHYPFIANLLSGFSSIRSGLGNFFVPFLPALRLPIGYDLRGKQAIVTGANSGIGFETAKALVGMGAYVILACRSAERGEEARKQIGGDMVDVEILDCASLESVRAFVSRWGNRKAKKVDILINNAGGILNTFTITADGFESAYQSNHLAHFLLTHSLLENGYMASEARIVTVSSIAFFSASPLDEHTTDSSDVAANFQQGEQLPWDTMVGLYDRAKAAQAVWSMTLQRKLQETTRWKEVVVQVCHPGLVRSPMLSNPSGVGAATGSGVQGFRRLVEMVGISNEQGAVVPVWLAIADTPSRPELRGLYWDRMRWMWVPAWSLEAKRQERLWEKWCSDASVSTLF